jgi:hypothetical protein
MVQDRSHSPRATDARVSSVVTALSVYIEPLVEDARVAILGSVELELHTHLLELGARSVHLYDPDPDRVARSEDEVPRGVSVRMLRDEYDVRDGAFDLVVIPDVGILSDPASAIVRLRRVVDARGAVVALGRARTNQTNEMSFPELAPAAVEYAELYDMFALQFESVTMTGVVPFAGVVFAELGGSDDLAVSVDTSLVTPDQPGVFVVLAAREETALDPYAIVQVARGDDNELNDTVAIGVPIPIPVPDESRVHEAATAFAAMQLKAELLATQLDEHRSRVASAESRAAAQEARLEQLVLERDVALTRTSELEGILAAAEQALGGLEKRLVTAERGMLERDDQIAALNAELDARTVEANEAREAELTTESVDPEVLAEVITRADRAEAALALHVADLAQVVEAHANETAAVEAQLQERARVIAEMDRELARREQLVRELVASLEEARDNPANAPVFESAPAAPGVAPEEVARLRRRLDDLAFDVARREGELVAQAWRITELENDKARLVARPTAPPAAVRHPAPQVPSADLEKALAKTRDELDALRQALTQEHAARVAAESGEELSHARAELARQAALLEQMRGRESLTEREARSQATSTGGAEGGTPPR